MVEPKVSNMIDGRPRVGLALGGGAARCIAHVGVLEALSEAGVPIDAISGTSGGSLVGALYASGLVGLPQLRRMALEMRWRNVILPTIPRMGLISSARISRYVRRVIGDPSFEEMKLPLAAVACDLRTGERVVLTTGPVSRAVQASCSLPVVFTPTQIDGHLLVDGWMISQIPVRAAREHLGADLVIAVDVNRDPASGSRLNNFVRIGVHLASLFARRYSLIERQEADVVIEVDTSDVSLHELEKARLLLARGREAVERKLGEIRARIASLSDGPPLP